jgi:hypothetical protein
LRGEAHCKRAPERVVAGQGPPLQKQI